jgi:type IV pilus assembly protein PilQ
MARPGHCQSVEPVVDDTVTVSPAETELQGNDYPDTAATRGDTAGKGAAQAPTSISQCLVTNIFYDTDLREVLQTMAAQCFVNLVADETVSGLITVELEDVPLEEAMRRVLSPYGLTYRWLDGYYLVGSPHPDNPSFPYLTETELYRPNFIRASDVPRLISTYYEPFMRVNDETNTLLLAASPELLARIKADLAVIDRPPRQVMIEALVTETSSDVSRQLGISWAADGSSDRESFRINAYPKARGDSAFLADPDKFTAFFERLGIRSGSWVGDFRAQLEALVQTGEARIRANPRVAVLEGKQARIFIGREEYFSILTGAVAYAYARLEVIKTGISLTITPYVSHDGFITLEVEPEVSDVIGSGSTGLPVTNKRSVITTVRVTEGETAVIGGLTVEYSQKVVRKVPLLGSIPILGHLFRHVESDVNESEITVLITPHLWQPEGDVQDNREIKTN